MIVGRTHVAGAVFHAAREAAQPVVRRRRRLRGMAEYVAVVGAGRATADEERTAEEVGRRLAAADAIVVCGGLGGVMEAACRGAKSGGGTTVGILPGASRSDANPFVDVALPTGLGELRNGLVVRAADAVVAVGGEFGTLSEIALALKAQKPVVAVGGWELSRAGEPVDAIERAATAEHAVALVLAACERG
jgi:uncharacterized protein (TIGR00725 family)